MKKLLVSLMVLSMVLVGCGNEEKDPEIIMITDVGTIDDKSFNQGTWEGVVAYGKANDIGTAYIQPLDQSKAEYINSIEQAIERGAKVVVTPGYLFEVAIYECQTKYPDVKFVLIDGNPHSEGYVDYETTSNTIGITFREEESGYLAGYAAVKEGATSLGFMGGMAVPAVISFGYGFIQGANDAAEELGVEIDNKYHYTGAFKATPDVQSKAAAWYSEGVEIIFACGGELGSSVMKAAQAYDDREVYVIGVDVDQSSESDTVITSAYKKLAVSVEAALAAIYDGSFSDKNSDTLYKGGTNIVLGAKEDATGLPMSTSKFTKFKQADYDKIYAEIVAGNIELLNASDFEELVGVTSGLTTGDTPRVTKVKIDEQ